MHMVYSVTSALKYNSEKEMNILKIRSDHGGEFENEPFDTILLKNMELSMNSLLLELHNKLGL